MNRKGAQRKLAAILSADVAGYSRLVEADEEGTVARLKIILTQKIEPGVTGHGGRIVKTSGDGLLAEFPSIVDAMRCALAMQDAVGEANAGIPAERHILFRIGVNLGDVLAEKDDIHGEGVNVAARLQQLAEIGGICVSRAVREQIGNRLPIAFRDGGEQTVKNIQQPIHVFHLAPAAGQGATAAPPSLAEADSSKPTIAVLPFVNMSGDSEQEFFADGLTEDIITELSRFRELFVISRTSTFKFKGKSVTVQDAAKELGVQYVVEGSVRKSGNRVRVTVQLIEAENGRHLWAERYDRQLEDIFAIQDEMTSAIVAILPGRVEAATRERVKRKQPDNLAAYECVLAGKILHHRSTKEDNAAALKLLERAIELDPNYAHAHAWRACTLGQAWIKGYITDRDFVWNEMIAELQAALAIADDDSDVHRILAAVHLTVHDFGKAVYHQDRALALNPNDDLIVVQQGEILTWLGRPLEGIEWVRKAMRLNPYHPQRFWNHLGRAYFVARRYAEAIEAIKHIGAPDQTYHAFLAACLARAGDPAAAREQAAAVMKLDPSFTIQGTLATLHYRNEDDREHHRESLLAAGFPA